MGRDIPEPDIFGFTSFVLLTVACSPRMDVVHMNIFRPKSRRISEVNLKGGWVRAGGRGGPLVQLFDR